MKIRKTWREKMEGAPAAKIVMVPGKGKMLVPCPLDVDALIRKVPRGKIVTQRKLRETLARHAGSDVACPITTGIFVRIVAEASAEQMRNGKSRVTPYWRVVRENGELIEKFPGGPAVQAAHLEAEGHVIDRSGKLRVKL